MKRRQVFQLSSWVHCRHTHWFITCWIAKWWFLTVATTIVFAGGLLGWGVCGHNTRRYIRTHMSGYTYTYICVYAERERDRDSKIVIGIPHCGPSTACGPPRGSMRLAEGYIKLDISSTSWPPFSADVHAAWIGRYSIWSFIKGNVSLTFPVHSLQCLPKIFRYVYSLL